MDVIEGNILVGDINATLNNEPVLSTGIEGNALKLQGKWYDFCSTQFFLKIEQYSFEFPHIQILTSQLFSNYTRKCGKYH